MSPIVAAEVRGDSGGNVISQNTGVGSLIAFFDDGIFCVTL